VKHLIPEFEELKKRLPPGKNGTLVLPCLHRIQDDRGYIADEDITGLVEYLGVPRIQIEEVLSFYTMLRRKPIGRWHVQVCRNVSCSMRGAERLIDHVSRHLGVKPGQTTADGRFTLSTVECLGSCGTAPVVMVNERYHELQDAQSLDKLLGELTEQ
jgi:NADH-quinone oxidoreductase subunit E